MPGCERQPNQPAVAAAVIQTLPPCASFTHVQAQQEAEGKVAAAQQAQAAAEVAQAEAEGRAQGLAAQLQAVQEAAQQAQQAQQQAAAEAAAALEEERGRRERAEGELAGERQGRMGAEQALAAAREQVRWAGPRSLLMLHLPLPSCCWPSALP